MLRGLPDAGDAAIVWMLKSRSRALIDERMIDRHLAYVQSSRHKEQMEWHGTPEQFREAEMLMSRDRTKDTSADYDLAGRDVGDQVGLPRMEPVSGTGTDDLSSELENVIRNVERTMQYDWMKHEDKTDELVASLWRRQPEHYRSR